MNALRSAAVIVCICCIACSIISLVAPLGKMKKIVNLVLGMFMICSMIIPVVGLFDSFSADFELDESTVEYNTDTSNVYNQLVLNQTADNLVIAANNLLQSEGITAENIEIGLKKSDNNSIYISMINIYISRQDENRAQDITKIISSNMSKEPVIIINE